MKTIIWFSIDFVEWWVSCYHEYARWGWQSLSYSLYDAIYNAIHFPRLRKKYCSD